ncbi:MAG: hypothetical protein ACI9KF_001113 [Arenicella sp.]|jgi:hypothetical protein
MNYCVFFMKNDYRIVTNTYFFFKYFKKQKERFYLPEALNTENAVLLFVPTNIGA